MSKPTLPAWKQALITTAIVVLGSLAIFFPAWLPESPALPTEDGIVEAMQFILLLATAAFWFGASRPAGRIGPFYQIMGALTLAAALGEADSLIEKTTHFPIEYFFIPLGIFILLKFKKHRPHFSDFFSEVTSHPAAGFFASAFMLIFVLAHFLGSPMIWKASLGENYHSDIPATVKAYLELLACYLLLVGTIGLSTAKRTHDPTEFD